MRHTRDLPKQGRIDFVVSGMGDRLEGDPQLFQSFLLRGVGLVRDEVIEKPPYQDELVNSAPDG